jgi:hypothetical protein
MPGDKITKPSPNRLFELDSCTQQQLYNVHMTVLNGVVHGRLATRGVNFLEEFGFGQQDVVLHKCNISVSGSIEDLTSGLFLIDAFLRSDSAAAGDARTHCA